MLADESVVEPGVGVVKGGEVARVAFEKLADCGVDVDRRLDRGLVGLLALILLSELMRDSRLLNQYLLLSLDLFNLFDMTGDFRGISPFFDQCLVSATLRRSAIACLLINPFLFRP